MTKQLLMELIRNLKSSNLIPAEDKLSILINYTVDQVSLFFALIRQGLINQDNVDCAIEMIYKMEDILSKYNTTLQLKEIYNNFTVSLLYLSNDITLDDINDFIIPLVDNQDFKEYYLRKDGEGFDFIKCAFKSGRKYLYDYSLLVHQTPSENKNITIEIYTKLLKSFNPELDKDQLIDKILIYCQEKVLYSISKRIEILETLNNIIDDEKYPSYYHERVLLENPEFLESTFFNNDYYTKLVHSSSSQLRNMSEDYQKQFFNILRTFDFNDSNLLIYMSSLLSSFDNCEDLNKIYNDRLKDKENGSLCNIGTSLYETIASNDEENLTNYLIMLDALPDYYDIKADTKIIYQKNKIKK